MPTGDQVEISYSLDSDDLKSFSRFYCLTSKRHRRARWRTTILLGVAGLLVAFDSMEGNAAFGPGSIYMAAIVLSAAVAYYGFYPTLVARNHVLAYKEGANSPLDAATTLRAGERIEVLIEGYLREEIEWRAVEKVDGTDDHLFIFLSALTALIVPKRAFGTEEEYRNFRKLISEQVTSAHGSNT